MRLQIRRQAAPKPNFTAMSDIAFQLIIFFMVAASFVNKNAENLEMPSNDPTQAQDMEDMITINANDKAMAVDGEVVNDIPELDQILAAKLAGRTTDSGRTVVLLSDDSIPFQKYISIVRTITDNNGIVANLQEVEGE